MAFTRKITGQAARRGLQGLGKRKPLGSSTDRHGNKVKLNAAGRLDLGGRTLVKAGKGPKMGAGGLRVGSAAQRRKFGPAAQAKRRKAFGVKAKKKAGQAARRAAAKKRRI